MHVGRYQRAALDGLPCEVIELDFVEVGLFLDGDFGQAIVVAAPNKHVPAPADGGVVVEFEGVEGGGHGVVFGGFYLVFVLGDGGGFFDDHRGVFLHVIINEKINYRK